MTLRWPFWLVAFLAALNFTALWVDGADRSSLVFLTIESALVGVALGALWWERYGGSA